MKYLKVENQDSLIRDCSTNSLLNIDSSGLAAYKIKKKQIHQIQNMEERMNNMENKIDKLNESIENLVILFKGNQ